MQRLLLITLAISTAIAGGMAFQFHRQIAERDAQLAALKKIEIEHGAALKAERIAREETAPLKENVARLTLERDQLKALAKSFESPTTAPEQPAKNAPPGNKGMFGGMAKMFQTEEGKKMLRAQTTMVVKLQYTDLAKRLKLSPLESDQLIGLLADRQNALTGDAFGAFAGSEPDPAKLKELGEKAEASRKEYDEKLKKTLGEQRFTEFQEYEKSVGERMMMTQFEQQFTSAGAPLDPTQKEQLIGIMSDERRKTPASVFDAGASQKDPIAALNAFKDEAAVDRWLQQEQDYQRRVLQSATKALNPDQINALQQAFQQTTEMQKFGLKMSREMFKGGSSPSDAPPPPPVTEKVEPVKR